jgi:protein-S-isoprenylcysteine O-methyltransferase Ste14
VWLAVFVVWCAARALGLKRRSRGKASASWRSATDTLLLALVSVGMLAAPFVYLLSPWLDFADYARPAWLGWVGAVIALFASWLLWRSHTDLGRHWAPRAQVEEDHTLVTDGVYGRIRHPMYAAHGLWAIAQVLLLPNWIAGPAMLAPFIPFALYRMAGEERLLAAHFGAEWRAWAARTGRMVPRLRGRE